MATKRHPRTVLLVEDNEDDMFFFRRAYKDAGLNFTLHTAANGQEAIDYMSGEGAFADRTHYPFPSAIFLDLKMPKKNGFEVLAWIRQTKGFEVPVAVLTSSPEDKDMRRARELGADTYLVKPPNRSMLLECWKLFNLTNDSSGSEPILESR